MIEVAGRRGISGKGKAFDGVFMFECQSKPVFITWVSPAMKSTPGGHKRPNTKFDISGRQSSLSGNPGGARIKVLAGEATQTPLGVMDRGGWWSLLMLIAGELLSGEGLAITLCFGNKRDKGDGEERYDCGKRRNREH